VELPGELADYEGSYMTFECNGLDADPVPPDPEFRNAKGYYGFTCYVNTLQMAEKITAVFHYGKGNAETVEDTYSVREYVRKVDHLYNTLGPGNPDGIPDQVFYLVRSLNDLDITRSSTSPGSMVSPWALIPKSTQGAKRAITSGYSDRTLCFQRVTWKMPQKQGTNINAAWNSANVLGTSPDYLILSCLTPKRPLTFITA
jgi:hypothetical protein